MVYGYARVSTKGQEKDGNSLEAQEKALKENGAIKIYADAFTGTKTDRPQFDKLMNELKSGDTLIVTKLDRFARSMSQGSELVSDLIERGIKVYILNIGVMDNTPSSKLIRNVFFAFAEFERDMIVERTQEGKAIAKQNNPNFKEGRPKTDEKKKKLVIELSKNHTIKEIIEITNLSRSTVMRIRKEHLIDNQ